MNKRNFVKTLLGAVGIGVGIKAVPAMALPNINVKRLTFELSYNNLTGVNTITTNTTPTLVSTWTDEIEADMQNFHGVDIKREVIEAMIREVKIP